MFRTTISDRPARAPRARRHRERGFTLAGLIVVLTVMMIVVAYTVPRQWSAVRRRDNDRQTIFAMRQYARAIMEWQRRHGGLPTSIQQLQEARSPRYIRGPKSEILDPLTGKMDWVLVPPNAVNPATQNNANGAASNVPTSVWNRPDAQGQTTATTGNPQQIGGGGVGAGLGGTTGSPNDYVGPFVGVRPPVRGQSFVTFNGAENYEQWQFTVQDLMNEINAKNNAMTQWK